MIGRTHRLISTTCLTALLFGVVPVLAFANPLDGVVSAGSAVISESGKKLDVHQQSDKVVIDWRGFDIAPDEHTQFYQPNSNSIALNRVNSNSASIIDGRLTANGNVVIVNQNGVMFGRNAIVDINGLIATTADIDNSKFMNNTKLDFDKQGRSNAVILNAGKITAKEAGLVGFVAPNVINSGIIEARLGRVHLASGDTATVDLYGDGLMKVAVSDDVKSQLVMNTGTIAANGGKIALTAAAGKTIVNSLINVQGTLKAQSVGVKNGEIIIGAAGSNAVANNVAADKGKKQGSSNVAVDGLLVASGYGAGEKGGKIEITGDNIALAKGAVLDTSGNTGGGDIKIGGDYLGTGITATASNVYVDTWSLIYNDAVANGDGGRTIIWSDGNTDFRGNIYARGGHQGGNGGFVETSGHQYLNAKGFVDLTAPKGNKGLYFLDPNDITIYGEFNPGYQSTDNSINLSSNLIQWLDSSDLNNFILMYNDLGSVATGAQGSNTINVDSAVHLAVGAKIRLGNAGAVDLASADDANTYIVTAIAGNTITLSSNLTQNYSGSSVYQGYVSEIIDKSGTGHGATQTNNIEMPLWLSNGVNGKSTIKFDGFNSYFHTPLMTITTFSHFTVLTQDEIPGTSGSSFGLIWGSNGSEGLYVHGPIYQYYNTTDYNIPLAQNTQTLLATIAGGGLTTGYFNDEQANTAVQPPARGFQYIGGYNSTNDKLNGTISEILLYDKELSSDERALVNQYQSVKWNVGLNPAGTGSTEAEKAMAADGYSVFTTRYLEYLSQTADISLQAVNNINLDLQGDTLNIATAGRNLSLTAGNLITSNSTGNIVTNGGNVTFTAGNDITLNNSINFTTNGGTLYLNGFIDQNPSVPGGSSVSIPDSVLRVSQDGSENDLRKKKRHTKIADMSGMLTIDPALAQRLRISRDN